MNEDHIDANLDPEEQLPPEGVFSNWEAVVDDMQATAEEYREDGWEVVELLPGDVMPLTGEEPAIDRYGIEVIVPGEDSRDVHELVDDPAAGFDACSVFRAVDAGIVFLVVVIEDPDREMAIALPAYYDSDDPDAQDMIEMALRKGEMRTHVRDLAEAHVSTFTHEEPELFFPPESN